MFTGIVEELGKVLEPKNAGGVKKLGVEAGILKTAKIGDSISVNGACLTIAEAAGNRAWFDVSQETLDKTYLGKIKPGEKVNLEAALKADSHLGGHFVTGHVDCVGKILNKTEYDKNWVFEVGFEPQLRKYIAQKGSVAVDGISLTVGEVKDSSFLVYIIPHTVKVTTLGFKAKNDFVNIETDVLAKYVENMLSKKENKSNISETFLAEHGFLA